MAKSQRMVIQCFIANTFPLLLSTMIIYLLSTKATGQYQSCLHQRPSRGVGLIFYVIFLKTSLHLQSQA